MGRGLASTSTWKRPRRRRRRVARQVKFAITCNFLPAFSFFSRAARKRARNVLIIALEGIPGAYVGVNRQALSAEDIQAELDRRKPGQSRFTTQRREPDAVRILSGVCADNEGRQVTTGTPISLGTGNVTFGPTGVMTAPAADVVVTSPAWANGAASA